MNEKTKMETTAFDGVDVNYFIKNGKNFYCFRDLNKVVKVDKKFEKYKVNEDEFCVWFFKKDEVRQTSVGYFVSAAGFGRYAKALDNGLKCMIGGLNTAILEAGNTSEEKENTEEKNVDNNLQVIYNQEVLGKEFKIYGTEENPLFLAQDVAEWIDYAWANAKCDHRDVSKMLKSVDEDEKLRGTIFLSGQNRDAWLLTEDGVYEVLMQSRKPIAKQFKKKVKEILKTIRKTGKYEVEQSPEMAMARGLIAAQEIIKAKDEQIKALTPKAEFADQLMLSDDYYSFDQLASKLSDAGIWRRDSLGKRIPVSRNYVYAVLRSDGFLTKERAGNKFKNRPYAKYTGGDTKYFTFRLSKDKLDYFHKTLSSSNYSDAQLISWYGKAYITQEGMRYFLDNKEMFQNREVDYKRNVWQMCV